MRASTTAHALSSAHFPLVDLLRATAAMLVLIYHVIALGDWKVFSGQALAWPFQQGWIGVDLFLVISGFVITLSAARALEKTPSSFRWPFMRRRLLRIVPLYLLTCLLYVFLVRPEILTRPAMEILALASAHLLFLQNLSPQTHGAINGVTWSLALEMQFYLLIVFFIRHILALQAGKCLVLMIGISWLWRYGTTWVLIPGEAIPHLQVIYTTQLPGTLDAFGVGIALALLVFGKGGAVARCLRPGWGNFALWMLASSALLSAAGLMFSKYPGYWLHLEMIVFWRTLLALGFGAALSAIITCPLGERGLLAPALYVGQISYGIYLWHFPLLLALLTQPGLRGTRLFIALVIGTLMLSSVSWHLMEKHYVNSGRR